MNLKLRFLVCSILLMSAAHSTEALVEQNNALTNIRHYELLVTKRYDELEYALKDELQRSAMIAWDRAKNGKTSIERVVAIKTLELLKKAIKKYPLEESDAGFKSLKVIFSSIPSIRAVLESNDGTISDHDIEKLNSELEKEKR